MDIVTTGERDSPIPLCTTSRTNQGLGHGLRLEGNRSANDHLLLRVVTIVRSGLTLRDDRGLAFVTGVVACVILCQWDHFLSCKTCEARG